MATDPSAAGEAAEVRHPVYIVDDDSSVRRSTWFLLEASGFAPRAFSASADFLNELDYLKPGAVVLDIRMPEPDGFQVLEVLRQMPAPPPVIVVTGYGDIRSAVRAMKLGAVDFLEKPFHHATLIRAVEHAVASFAEKDERPPFEQDAQPGIDILSARERQVLSGLAAGLSNKVIAQHLGLSPRTIEMHRAKMIYHLGVRTLPEALQIAFRTGLEPWPASLR
jgi:two-component system response regulator FixJ